MQLLQSESGVLEPGLAQQYTSGSILHHLSFPGHLKKCADLAYVTEIWLDATEGVSISEVCPSGFGILQQ